jgi:hypothetical protein
MAESQQGWEPLGSVMGGGGGGIGFCHGALMLKSNAGLTHYESS